VPLTGPASALNDSPGILLDGITLVHHAEQFRNRRRNIVRVMEQLDRSTGDDRLRNVKDQDLGRERCGQRYEFGDRQRTQDRADVEVNRVNLSQV
jgi:hypothetical protein